MIWLTWRQFRIQALVAAGLLVLLAIPLAIDGIHLVHLYETTVASCARHNDCDSVRAHFQEVTKWHNALDLVVLAIPALLGAFWGAPLVARELENRTNQLAWTQSVTRSRWFLVKISITGAASMVTAGLLSLMVTWWASPHDRLSNSPYSVFDTRDIVPIAYALFAFALGVLFGTFIRRSLPAMAATLAAFAAIRIAFTSWIRPRILSPLHSIGFFLLPSSSSVGVIPRGAGPRHWLFSEMVVNSAGHRVGSYDLGSNGAIIGLSVSPPTAGNASAIGKCINVVPSPPLSSTNQVQSAAQHCVDRLDLVARHSDGTTLPPV